MVSRVVVGLSGLIGCGKSTVANYLCSSLNFFQYSFGETVREIASSQGLPLTRATLQKVGNEIVKTRGIEWLAAEVCHASTQHDLLVVDGIRHRGLVESLHRLLPVRSFRLVYLDASLEVRFARILRRQQYDERNTLTREDLRRLDSQPVESEVPALLNLADLIVDANGDVTAIFDQVARQIPLWLSIADNSNRAT